MLPTPPAIPPSLLPGPSPSPFTQTLTAPIPLNPTTSLVSARSLHAALLCELLPACGAGLFAPWSYPLTLELASGLRARPLVSSYHKVRLMSQVMHAGPLRCRVN